MCIFVSHMKIPIESNVCRECTVTWLYSQVTPSQRSSFSLIRPQSGRINDAIMGLFLGRFSIYIFSDVNSSSWSTSVAEIRPVEHCADLKIISNDWPSCFNITDCFSIHAAVRRRWDPHMYLCSLIFHASDLYTCTQPPYIGLYTLTWLRNKANRRSACLYRTNVIQHKTRVHNIR